MGGVCTSNPMATREIWDKFPEKIYKIQNFPSAAKLGELQLIVGLNENA